MTKTYTVPLSSLKPWKGPRSQASGSTLITPKSPDTPDTQVLKRLKQISSTLKSLQNRHQIHQKVLQELHSPDVTDISTDIPIETLQNLWSEGKSKETPEQTAAVEKALAELMENPNISKKEKEFWIKISRTNNRTE